MKLNYLPLALALVLGVIIGVVVSGAAGETEAPPKPLVSTREAAAPVPISCPSVMAWRFADGSECTYLLQDGSVVTPPASATATDTPSPAPTSTATPSPTLTPTPTATSTPVVVTPNTPTPTPEQGTEVPTLPPLKECVLKVALAAGLNQREDPNISANKTGDALGQGTTLKVDAFESGPTYLWAHHYTGWTAVYVQESGTWWVNGLEGSTELCQDVPGWPAGLSPPPPIVTLPKTGPFAGDALTGIHLAWPVSHELIQQMVPYIGILKGVTLTCGNLTYAEAITGGQIVTIYRDYRVEHPSDREFLTDRENYVWRLLAAWDDAGCIRDVDYVEIMNEWTPPAEFYEEFSAFHIYVAQRVYEERGVCILAGSFGPGNPLPEQFIQLYDYFRWAEKHPCGTWPDGTPKYHGDAMHSSGFMPEWVDTHGFTWINWIYVAGRHRLYDALMVDTYGYSFLHDFPGPTLVTEMGFTYGFSESENVFSCDEKRAGIQETKRVYTLDGVDGFTKWNVGRGPTNWQDDAACIPAMLRAG